MKTFTLPPPTPLQRAQAWASNASWAVFGDYIAGVTPSWGLDAHEDGTISADSYEGWRGTVGVWTTNETGDLIITIQNAELGL